MDFEMIWTAIIKKENVTSSTTFTEANNPEEAFRSIWKVLVADGYEVLGVLKGNQTAAFYGVNVESLDIFPPKPVVVNTGT